MKFVPRAVVAVSFAAVAVVWWLLDRPLGIDSAVYRAAGFAVAHGEPLYAPLSALPAWAPELPFTYPPFAALVFVPLAALPVQLCWGLVAVAAPFAMFLVLREFTDRSWVLLAAFGLHPVWQSIGLGQLNLVLMALVVVDVLRLRGSRYGGVLIGLAAAVKLVPLIFIGHLLLTGRRADALRALATFAVATTLGFVLLPGDSVRYWTSAVYSGHFAEMKAWVGNQSWAGFWRGRGRSGRGCSGSPPGAWSPPHCWSGGGTGWGTTVVRSWSRPGARWSSARFRGRTTGCGSCPPSAGWSPADACGARRRSRSCSPAGPSRWCPAGAAGNCAGRRGRSSSATRTCSPRWRRELFLLVRMSQAGAPPRRSSGRGHQFASAALPPAVNRAEAVIRATEAASCSRSSAGSALAMSGMRPETSA